MATKEILFCSRCNVFFDSKFAFQFHLQEHILNADKNMACHMPYIDSFICSQCYKTFESKSELIIHYNTECLTGRFICKHCKVNCERLSRLMEHLMCYHNYSPDLLACQGLYKDTVASHVVGNDSFERNIGNEALNYNVSLETPVFYNIGDTDYTTGSNFQSRWSLNSNNSAFHLFDEANICEICPESTSFKCALDMHEYPAAADEISTNEIFFCRRCNGYLNSRSTFEFHLQRHLLDTDKNTSCNMRYIERFNCSQCSKTFEEESQLNTHYSTVCLTGIFICKHCNVDCQHIRRLREHLMSDHNYTPSLLASEGLFKDILRSHVIGDDSFERSLGDEAQKYGVSVEAPEFYNIGDTDYIPGYNFKSRYNRKSNNSKCKLNDKAYLCELCQESFSRKCVLDKHIEKHRLDQEKVLKKYKAFKYSTKSIAVKAIKKNIKSKQESKYKDFEPTIMRKRNTQKIKNADILKLTEKYSAAEKSVTSTIDNINCNTWKKIKLKRKFKRITSSCDLKKQESSKPKKSEIKPKTMSSKPNTTHVKNVDIFEIIKEQELGDNSDTSSWKKIKLKRIFKRVTISDVANVVGDSKGIKKLHQNKLKDTKAFNPTCESDKTKNAASRDVVSQHSSMICKNVRFSDHQNEAGTSRNIMKESPQRRKSADKKNQQIHNIASKNEAKSGFICEVCKKKFQDSCNLKRHFFIHSGKAPYTCKSCNKTFAIDDHLKSHINSVCSEK